jgi:hypothetical protein
MSQPAGPCGVWTLTQRTLRLGSIVRALAVAGLLVTGCLRGATSRDDRGPELDHGTHGPLREGVEKAARDPRREVDVGPQDDPPGPVIRGYDAI